MLALEKKKKKKRSSAGVTLDLHQIMYTRRSHACVSRTAADVVCNLIFPPPASILLLYKQN